MKVGSRIRLLAMPDDPNPVETGTLGTVRFIDDMGTLHVNWDNGRTLGVVPRVDRYEEVPDKCEHGCGYCDDPNCGGAPSTRDMCEICTPSAYS